MVATICVHALLPIGTPLARTNGSPFSAATVEVSTAPRTSAVNIKADGGERAPDKASGSADAESAIVQDAGIRPAMLERARPAAAAAPGDLPLQAGRGSVNARAPPLS